MSEKNLSDIKVGDTVGIEVDDISGNAYRCLRLNTFTGIVRKVGRRWIAVERTESGLYSYTEFDRETGYSKDNNDGLRLWATPEQARETVERKHLVRYINHHATFLPTVPLDLLRQVAASIEQASQKKQP